MAEASGGGTVPDQFAGLDIPALFDKPILAAREAMAVTSESARVFFERELRKRGMNDNQ